MDDTPLNRRSNSEGRLTRVTADPALSASTFPAAGTSRDLCESRQVVVRRPLLRAHRAPETTQPIVAEWPRGHRFWVRGWIIGEAIDRNPVWWLTGRGKSTDRRWCVWSGGTDISGHDVLTLPCLGKEERHERCNP